MSDIVSTGRTLIAVAGIASALWLSGCGGSSKTTGQTTSSSTSTGASSQSSATAQSGANSQSTTSATASASEAQVAAARASAIKMYAGCLRAHGLNPKATKAVTNREKRLAAKCLAQAEAAFKSATRSSTSKH